MFAPSSLFPVTMGCTTEATPPPKRPNPCITPQSQDSQTFNDEEHNNEHKILDDHPLTLYVVGRLTTLCLDKPVLHTVGATMLDILPDHPAETALKKLHHRRSYMAKAPYQRRSKWKALHDKGLKLCPASWLGPAIIKAHDKYEYKRDRKHTQEVYIEWQEKRGRIRRSTSANSIVGLETHPAPVEWSPLDGEEEADPWALPPIEEMD